MSKGMYCKKDSAQSEGIGVKAMLRRGQGRAFEKTTVLIALLLGGFFSAGSWAADDENLLFSSQFESWSTRKFEGETNYELQQEGSQSFVRAASEQSASAKYHKQTVDLTKTPWLCWRWRIQDPVDIENERLKSGDDFAARVYVVHAPSFWPGSVRSINYVWASREKPGGAWPNPFTDKAMMVPLRNADDGVNQWKTECRNVVSDLQQYYQRDVKEISGVAIMTDTDNAKLRAVADYAEMYFLADPQLFKIAN